MAQKGKGKKKAANGYVMPDPIPEGEIVTDTSKKQWKLGPSIGTGGFGEIYSAHEVGSSAKASKYVVKIEPIENGPLFVEMHCYTRIAKPNDVQEFCKKKNIATIGMPVIHGSGSHSSNGKKYRFIVIPKFGTDIWKLFLQNNKQFPPITVYKLGLQMLDVLEYVHSKGYIHADLKGSNILLGNEKNTKNQAYLVDFGLASKYTTDKEFKPDPKTAHNGTIEYLSRDAHQGVQTRRGDLEILGYNLIHWLGCTLPWEKNLSDPKAVQKSKETSMKDIPKFLEGCFGDKPVPAAITKYFEFVGGLDFNAAPDYKKLYKILLDGLESEGGTISSPLNFKTANTPTKRKVASAAAEKRLKKRQKIADEEEPTTSENAVAKKTKKPAKGGSKAKKPTKAAANKQKIKEENGIKDEKSDEIVKTPTKHARKQNEKSDETAETPTKHARKQNTKQEPQPSLIDDGNDDEVEEEPIKSSKKSPKVKAKKIKKAVKKKQINVPSPQEVVPVENNDEVTKGTPKKRGGKPIVKKDIQAENGVEAETVTPTKRALKRTSQEIAAGKNDDEEEVKGSPKKRSKKQAAKKDAVQEAEVNEYPGYTAEMVAIQKRIESKKKSQPPKKPKKAKAEPQPSTSRVRPVRSKKT